MRAAKLSGQLGVGIDPQGDLVGRWPPAAEPENDGGDGDSEQAEDGQRNRRGAAQQPHRNRDEHGQPAGQRRQPDQQPPRIASPPLLIGSGDDVLDPAIWRLRAQSGHGIRLTISENGRLCRGICHGFGT